MHTSYPSIPGAGQTFVMEIVDGGCHGGFVCGLTPTLLALLFAPPPGHGPSSFFTSPGTRDYMIDINVDLDGIFHGDFACPGRY